MSTIELIQQQLAAKFALEPVQLLPDSRLDEAGLDSLGIIEFMFNVEDEFKIKLPEERVEVRTVREIAALVDKLVLEQHGKAA